jgi:Domain of unknown function (DUF4258)
MRFTHHARNRMRHYGISLAEIRVVLADPIHTRQDGRGNQKVTGAVGGRSVVVVLAADDPGLIITLYTKRRA